MIKHGWIEIDTYSYLFERYRMVRAYRRLSCTRQGCSYWFDPLSPDTGSFDAIIREVREHRKSRANKDLRDWLSQIRLPYHSPHKFRHGDAVYGLKQSKDIADLKAVSQNLMHFNISITDGIYGILSAADVGQRIRRMGKQKETGKSLRIEISDQLIVLALQIKQGEKA